MCLEYKNKNETNDLVTARYPLPPLSFKHTVLLEGIYSHAHPCWERVRLLYPDNQEVVNWDRSRGKSSILRVNLKSSTTLLPGQGVNLEVTLRCKECDAVFADQLHPGTSVYSLFMLYRYPEVDFLIDRPHRAVAFTGYPWI